MENRIVERSIDCPFCAETISILLDLSAGNQAYIEDCQVCCQPIEVTVELADGEKPIARVDCAS